MNIDCSAAGAGLDASLGLALYARHLFLHVDVAGEGPPRACLGLGFSEGDTGELHGVSLDGSCHGLVTLHQLCCAGVRTV